MPLYRKQEESSDFIKATKNNNPKKNNSASSPVAEGVSSGVSLTRGVGKFASISSSDLQKFAGENVKSAHQIVLNIARIIAERLRQTNQDMKKLTTVLTIALRRPHKH